MARKKRAMTSADRERLKARRCQWVHPKKPWLAIPVKTATVLALLETGVRDTITIASATGLAADEIADIDNDDDKGVRQIRTEGIPGGEYFPLAKQIRCPGCGGRITVAPCVACRIRFAVAEPEPTH